MYIGIRNLSGGEFMISFLSIPRIVVHGKYCYSAFFYLFIFLLVFPCLFVVVLFLFFDDQDDLCS